jgi:vacuolar-type H+-ATPase subunit C/Vma6
MILKSQVSGIPYTDSMIEPGTIGTEEFAAAIGEEKYRFVPDHLQDTALAALADYKEHGRLEAIGCRCDCSMWRHLMQKARKSRNRIVIELFREYINLSNIKTFFRVKEFADDPMAFERYFISGGDYEMDFFLRHMGDELGLFLAELAKTRYERDIVSYGLQMWPEEKSFWRLEIACDNFILNHFWKMRMRLFSIAPLIYYLLRKVAETKQIRTIIRCKLIGMPRPQIEERLRYIYV